MESCPQGSLQPGLVQPGSCNRGPLQPGLVQPGSRRRRQQPPAERGGEAHLAGVLQAYLDTLRQDSYTRPCLVEDCVTVHRDIPEEGAHSSSAAARPPPEAKYSASFVFPTCCPHRSKFQAEEQRSANEAKNAVFVQAIEALQAAAPERFELPKPEDNVHSIPLDSVVPGAKLAMYRLEVKAGSLGAGEVRRFGLLSALPPSRYAFQLEVWDEGVRPDCHGEPAPDAGTLSLGTVRV